MISKESITPAEQSGDESGAEDANTDRDVEQVFAELYRKREEWLQEAEFVPPDFKVSLSGGAWTLANRGVAYDVFMGSASTLGAKAWCTKYSLNKSRRYTISLYGQELPVALAHAWCKNTQYYYGVYCLAANEKYLPTEADHQGYLEEESFKELVAGLKCPGLKAAEKVRGLKVARRPKRV